MYNRVKEFRKILKITQAELAKRSKVSRNTISAIETNKKVNLTYEKMLNISNALNEKISVIFFND